MVYDINPLDGELYELITFVFDTAALSSSPLRAALASPISSGQAE